MARIIKATFNAVNLNRDAENVNVTVSWYEEDDKGVLNSVFEKPDVLTVGADETTTTNLLAIIETRAAHIKKILDAHLAVKSDLEEATYDVSGDKAVFESKAGG